MGLFGKKIGSAAAKKIVKKKKTTKSKVHKTIKPRSPAKRPAIRYTPGGKGKSAKANPIGQMGLRDRPKAQAKKKTTYVAAKSEKKKIIPDSLTLAQAKKIIADRIKKNAKPGEMALRAQKEKLKATKPKTAEGRAKKKAKIKELNKKIYAMTGKLEGIKNPFAEAMNIKNFNLIKLKKK
tara:strand:+ start:765 stop:1304 length:540 start_codon:yes stop_codon:yes gene_type:complete